MTRFWMRWYAEAEPDGADYPWWLSGESWRTDGQDTYIFVALIEAKSEEAAWALIEPTACVLERSFCNPRDPGWVPWESDGGGRFPRPQAEAS